MENNPAENTAPAFRIASSNYGGTCRSANQHLFLIIA